MGLSTGSDDTLAEQQLARDDDGQLALLQGKVQQQATQQHAAQAVAAAAATVVQSVHATAPEVETRSSAEQQRIPGSKDDTSQASDELMQLLIAQRITFQQQQQEKLSSFQRQQEEKVLLFRGEQKEREQQFEASQRRMMALLARRSPSGHGAIPDGLG